MNSEFDSPLNESLLPLIEYMQFRELADGPSVRDLSNMSITLPNGVAITISTKNSLVYENRSLAKSTPRMVSGLRIINCGNIDDAQLIAWALNNINKCLQHKTESSILT